MLWSDSVFCLSAAVKAALLRSVTAIAGLLPSLAFAQTPLPSPLPGFDSKSEIQEGREAPPGATVNRQTNVVDRAADIIYYRYKGVDLPLKKFLEYEGSQPFVQIIDGEDVLWVAKRADLYRMLDKVLYNELDTMTGAADDLYDRNRWPAAHQAYQDVLEVLVDDANDLATADLRHYPAVKSYLQLRMGQSLAFQSKKRWQDAQDFLEKAFEDRESAKRFSDDAVNEHLAPVYLASAKRNEVDAEAAAVDAEQMSARATKLLETAVTQNDRLWQAHNELGILAVERAIRASMDGRFADSKKEYEAARERFRKARAGDAKEMVDGNLIAVYSGLADLAHAEGRYGDALDALRDAMEITPDFAEGNPDAPPSPGAAKQSGMPAFEVSFTDFNSIRGERIVVTAELNAGLARKYLEIERDRRRAAKLPPVTEVATAVPALWKKRGDQLLKKKHWGGAIALFTGLHDVYLMKGAPESASPEFKQYVQASLERAFSERANVLVKAGRDDDAIALLALSADYVPNSRLLANAEVMGKLRKADAALAGARWEEAVGHLLKIHEKIYKPQENDAEKVKTSGDLALRLGAAYVGLTRAALARGDLETAGRYADKARRLKPERAEWRENHGRVLIAVAKTAEAAGDMDGALAMYERARAEGSGASAIRAAFSRDKLRVQLFVPKARRQLVSATRQYGAVVVFLGLGLVLGVPATRTYLSASSRRRRAKSLRAAALVAYDGKKWNEAVDLFNDFLVQSSGSADGEAFELLARAYRQIGDYENALRYFDRAANRLPGRRYNLERAEIYLMRRNLPLALRQLRTSSSLQSDAEKLAHLIDAIRTRDGDGPFLIEAMGAVRLTAGDFDGAKRLYNRLLELDPRNTKILRAMADLSRRAGRDKERRMYMEKLVQVDPEDVAGLRELGNLYATAGELPQAIAAFRRAFDMNPGEGLAARIAELEAELLVREAESEITRLSAEQPTPNRRFRIGELHWRLGRPTEAKRFFEECATIKELQVRALRYLGLIAHAQGDPNDAISLLRGYLAKRTNLAPDAPEKEARYALAEAYEQIGDSDLSTAQFDAIFEADPGYKDVAKRVKVKLTARTPSSPSGAATSMDCPFCKRRVPANAEFCPNCRFNLASGKAPATPRSDRLALPGKMPGDDEDPKL